MDIKAMIAEVNGKEAKPVSTTSLVDILHKKLTTVVPARSTKNIHASSVTREDIQFCPRQYILMDITGTKPKGESLTPSLQATFDYGRFLESKIQNDWLGDISVGDWKCECCGETRTFCKKPQDICSNGHTHLWRYKELRVKSPTCGISCGIDCLLDLGAKKLTLLEIKTMAADQWKQLRAPKTEHRIRTSLYLRVVSETALSEHVFTDEAKIVYVCKGYGGKHKGRMTFIKEYVIKRTDSDTDFYYNQSQLVYDYRQGKTTIIPDGICNVSFCGRAQSCPVVKECFSGRYK